MFNKFLLFLVLAVSLTFISCSDDDDNGTNSSSGYSMTAKVDGSNWESISAVMSAINTQAGLVITGSTNTSGSDVISLTIPSYDGSTGEFTVGGMTNLNYATYLESGSNAYVTLMRAEASGVINITEASDGTIKGTFNFNAFNTGGEEVNVTDGKFNMKIISQ